jgi:hypothetical protein
MEEPTVVLSILGALARWSDNAIWALAIAGAGYLLTRYGSSSEAVGGLRFVGYGFILWGATELVSVLVSGSLAAVMGAGEFEYMVRDAVGGVPLAVLGLVISLVGGLISAVCMLLVVAGLGQTAVGLAPSAD